MKFYPCDIDYKFNGMKPTLRIFGRDDKGKRVIKYVSGTEPYFYTKEKEALGIKDSRIIRYENAPPSLYGDKCIKVICNNPAEVAGRDAYRHYVRDNFQSLYESDTLYGNRCRIDYHLSGVLESPEKSFISIKDIKQTTGKVNLRSHFLDIETIGSSIQEAIKGKAQIPCLTVYDNHLQTYFLFTTIPLTLKDIEEIKSKTYNFWVNSLEKLKLSHPLEKEEEKQKSIEKQIKYLERNLIRILNFKISVKVSPDESQMLNDYTNFNVMNRPDVKAGWNNKKFDEPAIVNRMKTLNLPYQQLSDVGEVYISKRDECNVTGVILFDLMDHYVKMQMATPSHRSLDYISKKELGVGKYIKEGYNLYLSEPNSYLAYNIVDVMLTVELDLLLHIIDFYVEVTNLTNSNLDEISASSYIDNLILTYCNNVYVLPTRGTIETKGMSGGMVYSPVPGLHKNVLLLDFRGMYPSIMKSLNISPETKSPTGDVIAANGVRFDSNKMGIIPYILKSLDTKRNELKKFQKEADLSGNIELALEYDLKQAAVKRIANAMYGVMGFSKFRLADGDVGDAVTSTGRMLSMTVKEFVEKKGYKVVYGDTDSILIEIYGVLTYSEMKELGNKLVKEINDYLPIVLKKKFNCDTCFCSIEADEPYKVLAMLPKKTVGKDEEETQAKKRYAAYKWIGEDKYKFIARGVEYVKGNTADITRYVQEKLLKYVLDETDTATISIFLKSLYDDFFNNVFPIEQIGKPSTIRKPLDEYASDIPIKRACEFSNRYLKKEFDEGSSFVMYYLLDAITDVIAISYGESIPPDYHVDMRTTWNKLVDSPTETILQTRNLKWDDIIHGTRDNDTTDDILSESSSLPTIIIKTTPKACDKELELDMDIFL